MQDASSTVILGALESSLMADEEEVFFHEEKLSGIVVFKRNIPDQDYKKLPTLLKHFQAISGTSSHPCMIAIDQEGGRVARLDNGFPNMGNALNLFEGKTDQETLTKIQNYSAQVASELKHLGIQINFAPVLDILTEERNHSIGDRAFGRDAESVTLRAGAFIRGHELAGVDFCLKHFPGQGHSVEDTHHSASIIDISYELMNQRELAPFRNLIDKARLVMMSHSIYPQIDKYPASLSAVMIQEILQNTLGFKGLVVSDDMNMAAISQESGAWEQALVEAILAGADLILICQKLDRLKAALKALRKEEKKSKVFAKRLELSAQKVMNFRATL